MTDSDEEVQQCLEDQDAEISLLEATWPDSFKLVDLGDLAKTSKAADGVAKDGGKDDAKDGSKDEAKGSDASSAAAPAAAPPADPSASASSPNKSESSLKSFTVTAKSSCSDSLITALECQLLFTLPARYPLSEPPEITIKSGRGITKDTEEDLGRHLREECCPPRIGQAMIFDLLLCAQDFLDSVVVDMRQPSLHTALVEQKK
jgi:hypothetical protein